MTITAVLVLFAVTWFMLLLIILPLSFTSQQEDGHVVPGTSPSAPVDAKFKQKVKWVTGLSIPITALIVWIILSGIITLDQFDIYNGIK